MESRDCGAMVNPDECVKNPFVSKKARQYLSQGLSFIYLIHSGAKFFQVFDKIHDH